MSEYVISCLLSLSRRWDETIEFQLLHAHQGRSLKFDLFFATGDRLSLDISDLCMRVVSYLHNDIPGLAMSLAEDEPLNMTSDSTESANTLTLSVTGRSHTARFANPKRSR